MSHKFEVLYIINSLNVGGAQVGLCRLLNGLNSDELQVHIFVLNDYDQNIINRLPDWVTYDIIDASVMNGVRKSCKLIKKTRTADVIVGSLFHATILARILGIISTKSAVATWQHNENFKNKHRQRLIGLTNTLSDVVLADSEHVAEVYQNLFDVNSDFVRSVPIAGINMDQYSQRQHLDRDIIRVGSVGSLTPQKNYQALIKVADKMHDENVQFLVAGDGPERESLKKEINRRKLDNIKLLGKIESVAEFLSQIDIYVQPSVWEGLCITVIEAMAVGLPVIGSRTGGIQQNVHDGKNGFLCDPNNIECIVDSIGVLSHDVEMRTQFGNYGCKVVQNKYTQSVLVSKFKSSAMKNY